MVAVGKVIEVVDLLWLFLQLMKKEKVVRMKTTKLSCLAEALKAKQLLLNCNMENYSPWLLTIDGG